MNTPYKILILVCLFGLSVFSVKAETEKYRLIITGDPSHTIKIAFNAISGNNHTVYYDSVDHGDDVSQYPYSETVYKSVDNFRGMNTKFIKLINLQPKTTYYFVVSDDNSVSRRFYFTTASNDANDPISYIMGGDSRNNREKRQKSNILVSKLKPNFVAFAGDFTNLATSSEWKDWFDDWQLTTCPDGRMIPIVPAEGNHEKSANATYSYIERFFDTSPEVYYAFNYGGNLIRFYTLNTEISISGNQTSWLTNDLVANDGQTDWKFAQYHQAMRPHSSQKANGTLQYSNWANLFYYYGVRLVQESDVHLCKTTWPIIPTGESDGTYVNQYIADEGFVRHNHYGTVYTGSGCWGAPKREVDDAKVWTKDAEKIDHFQWVWVARDQIQIRTVKTFNAYEVCANESQDLVDTNGTFNDTWMFAREFFQIPRNLEIWNPENGDMTLILNHDIVQVGANFSASTLKGTAPLAIDFDASSSYSPWGALYDFDWDFGDGANENGFTPYASHTYTSPGEYKVKLGVTDGGIYSERHLTIIVEPSGTALPEDLVINEIVHDPSPTFDSGDFIEIYNPNSYDVDLSCYRLTDSDDYHTIENVIIPKYDYWVFAEDLSKFKSQYPNVANVSEYYTNIDLFEIGDYIELINDRNQLVDRVDYDIASPWPDNTNQSGLTLSLLQTSMDNLQAFNWDESYYVGGTPGEENFTNPPDTRLYAKLFLQGPYNTTNDNMNTHLWQQNLIPDDQPYRFTNHNYMGNETTSIMVSQPSDIVDWIYLELRSVDDSSLVVDKRAAFLKNDGTIIDLNGTHGVNFPNAQVGDYYYASFAHRTHLGVIASTAIQLPNASNQLDLTQNMTSVMGFEQMTEIEPNTFGLMSGDFDANHIVNNLDYNHWGGESAVVNAYVTWDADMNAIVNNVDYNLWDSNKSKVGVACAQN